MKWVDVAEAVKAIAPVFTAGAACFGAYIGYRGLERWRAETIGKRKAELAEEVLAWISTKQNLANAVPAAPGGFPAEMPGLCYWVWCADWAILQSLFNPDLVAVARVDAAPTLNHWWNVLFGSQPWCIGCSLDPIF